MFGGTSLKPVYRVARQRLHYYVQERQWLFFWRNRTDGFISKLAAKRWIKAQREATTA